MIRWPRRGDHHPFIRLAQRKLAVLGYAVTETGTFDDQTWHAVEAFALQWHLPANPAELGRVWLALWREAGKVEQQKEGRVS
jgi:N-acetyl-anhydromuramyl-L-alanine amidase AmpD